MPADIKTWATWIAITAGGLEVLDTGDVIKLQHLARRQFVAAQQRQIALVRGEKDPVDGQIYGPIGSAAYDPKMHGRILEEIARRQSEYDQLQTLVDHKLRTIVFIVLGAAGVVAFTDAVSPGAPRGIAGMGSIDPLALGALLLGGYAVYEQQDGPQADPVRAYLRDGSRRLPPGPGWDKPYGYLG